MNSKHSSRSFARGAPARFDALLFYCVHFRSGAIALAHDYKTVDAWVALVGADVEWVESWQGYDVSSRFLGYLVSEPTAAEARRMGVELGTRVLGVCE